MTTDRRIKRTRDALSNALITLIKTTPLKKISIQSVVDIANVSRSTFYVHFDDIFDLYEQTINELLAGLADRMDADYPSPQENNFAVLTKDFIAFHVFRSIDTVTSGVLKISVIPCSDKDLIIFTDSAIV